MSVKTRTVTERIGENMGPIDWSYDFRSHFDSYGSGEEFRDEACRTAIRQLREASEGIARGEKWEACCYDHWHEILDIGMYDGWPFWRPVPSMGLYTFLGVEWHNFSSIRGVRQNTTENTKET